LAQASGSSFKSFLRSRVFVKEDHLLPKTLVRVMDNEAR